MRQSDSLLAAVPMFHVNAWGLPYATAMCGAKLVFPGSKMDGASVYELMAKEEVRQGLLLGLGLL